ncbi:MAG TPA: hypothetical protein VGV12_07425 [Gemmatimonadales bacterium]|nr:hypothetical protein [Gemmatimonadales bacterium]
MKRWRSVVAVAVMLLGTECYNYQPLGGSRLTPSMFVAVTLTESGSEQLAPYIGPSILVVRGRFRSATEHGLLVSVASVENRRGNLLEWKGESVVIPGEFVRALEERQGAVGKTALLAGASLVGFFAAYAAFGPSAGGMTGGGGTGGGSSRQ